MKPSESGIADIFPLVIFDWDGTVADSIGLIVAALQKAIQEHGLPARSDEQLRDIIGLGLKDALLRLFPELPLDETMGLAERYREHYFVQGAKGVMQAFAGMPALLERLGAAGRKLAVATGKSRRGLDLALEQSGLGSHFVATRCADESVSKPAPDMVNELLDTLWMEQGEAVVIGDSEYDLQMAANAGVASIGVTWGVHSREHLMRFGPLAVVDSVEELGVVLLGSAAG